MLEPDSREPWFICESHADMDFGKFGILQQSDKKLSILIT